MDLIVEAHGDVHAVAAAHERAWLRFREVLNELVHELPALRSPVGLKCPLQGGVARRMWDACQPFSATFITPMAAVAGSVAEEILTCFSAQGVRRAWVNNGGDIALYLTEGEAARVGVVADIAGQGVAHLRNSLVIDGVFCITSAMPVRGVATSGWRGRSHSLGIADSVTVLAGSAAQADAAATMVANAVNVDVAGIERRSACEIKDDSDLGAIPVTVNVPTLANDQVHRALQAGLHKARELQEAGHLWCALLSCQGRWVATSLPEATLNRNTAKDSSQDSEISSAFS